MSDSWGRFHQHFWQKVNGKKCKVAFKLQKKLELFAQKIFEDTAKAVRVQNF
jgi:hypothetical protein